MTKNLIPLPHFHSGKVRDTYEIPGFPSLLLMVASDRISTHNVVHQTEILGKGELLTALMLFWKFTVLGDFETHLLAYGREIYKYLPPGEYPDDLHLRAIIIGRRPVHQKEFIYRDYLVGSLWELYKEGKDPYKLRLPAGLTRMHRFEETIFTPTEKSEHDEPLSHIVVSIDFKEATRVTRAAYQAIKAYLLGRGIVLMDAKFEASGGCLVDEWGTGDCCRMATVADVAESVKEGRDPRWLDKEEARQIALQKWKGGEKVPLSFTPYEVTRIAERYHEAFELITGVSLDQFQEQHLLH